MSGSKSGGFTLAPLAMPIVLVAAGVAAAVNAYTAARERIRREREQAMSEQRNDLGKALDEWRQKLAASAKVMVDPQPSVRSSQEIIAGMVAPLQSSSSLKAEDFLQEPFAAAADPLPAPDTQGRIIAEQCRKVIENIQGFLNDLRMALPKDVSAMIKSLHREQDIEKAANIAGKIRIRINQEIALVRQEQLEAKDILDSLPPDFPETARNFLCEVASGRCRFDDDLREFLRKAEEQMVIGRQRATAKILNDTLSGLGYEVEPVGDSIFTEGGKVHFRKSDWDDGYCVKLNVSGDRINFNMQKAVESGRDMDEALEQGWKSEFEEVQEKLGEAGIRITIDRVCEPGNEKVPVNHKIPIDTRKKDKKKAAATAQQSRMGVRR